MMSNFWQVEKTSSKGRSALLSSGRLHFAQAALEEAALAVVGDEGERPLVIFRRFGEFSEAAQQIGARSVQQVIVVEIVRGGESSIIARPARGPSAMATATARFKETMGEGCTRSS